MRARFPNLQLQAWQTRVARRVFLLFVTCALVPVGFFALFAYDRVVGELERDALDRLHRESKNAGMSIIERLLLLDDGMRIVLRGLADHSPAALEQASQALNAVARGGSTGLRLEPGLVSSLSAAQRSELARGRPVLLALPREGAPARLCLLRSHDADGRKQVLVADLVADYVYAPEGRDLSDHYWVEDARGRRLFASQRAGWRLQSVAPLASDTRNAFRWESEGESFLGAGWSLFLASTFSADAWYIAHGRSRLEIQQPLDEFKATFPLVVALSILAVAWVSLVQIRRRLVPIAELVAATRRVATRQFAGLRIQSGDEFEELATAFNEMSAEIRTHLDVLGTVNAIGISLSAENDIQRLMELVVRGASSVTGADGGALFLASEGGELQQTVLVLSGTLREPPAGSAPGLASAEACAVQGPLHRLRGAGGQAALEPGEWQPLEVDGYRIGALMAVPLRNDRGETIGVLELLRAVDPSAAPIPFNDDARELALSIGSQAAVALTKTRLVDSFRALFEGLIQLTVRAIDEKSAHTGQHCRKVPVLAEMIADAACGTEIGPLKDFDLTPEQRYELRIAALLHDCGKVVTPVHVMDKGTKLETIHDRIELVALRLALLAREAELGAVSEALSQCGGDPQEALAGPELQEFLSALVAERHFLEKCNIGGEFMVEENQQRVRGLAETHRFRDLDGALQPLLTPEEIDNLNIARGTLNDEEREIINYHATATIKLLEELPFPKHMQNVPTIAGSHHERMDGKGYPNRLRGDEISMQGRILGLADVFEALTAKDRPYKPGKTLSQSLEILGRMRDEGHIDPNLYRLFVDERLYLRYAIEYLSPEQIDEAHSADWELLTSSL